MESSSLIAEFENRLHLTSQLCYANLTFLECDIERDSETVHMLGIIIILWYRFGKGKKG